MITLCERLAGQDANVTTVPVSVLRFTRQLTRFFEWTNDVADRLAFSEVISLYIFSKVHLLKADFFSPSPLKHMTVLSLIFDKLQRELEGHRFHPYILVKKFSFFLHAVSFGYEQNSMCVETSFACYR